MDRPPQTSPSVRRILAVALAACLGAGYVIFAQVNAQRPTPTVPEMAGSSAQWQMRGTDGILEIKPKTDGLPSMPYLASSSKSGTIVREAEIVLGSFAAPSKLPDPLVLRAPGAIPPTLLDAPGFLSPPMPAGTPTPPLFVAPGLQNSPSFDLTTGSVLPQDLPPAANPSTPAPSPRP